MIEIPDKLYFKIGEVADLAHVEPYVIRFWQREFKQLQPKKNQKGQRRFTRKDVEIVLTIARLRYQEKYSIGGIKKLFREKQTHERVNSRLVDHHDRIRELLEQVKTDVESMLDLFRTKPPS